MNHLSFSMKQFKLLRYYANNGDYKKEVKNGKEYFYGTTIGALYDTSKTNYPPFCYTLERPLFYNGVSNKRDDKITKTINESCCIPVGEYLLKWTFSPKYKRHMYLVVMQGRDGIRIHSANDINDLLGCIALGTRIIKNVVGSDNAIYDYIISDSRSAIKKFEDYCAGEDIKLIIEDLNQIENLSKIRIE